MVDTSYNTSNRIKSYLSRFWEYYQTAPELQKAIENLSPYAAVGGTMAV